MPLSLLCCYIARRAIPSAMLTEDFSIMKFAAPNLALCLLASLSFLALALFPPTSVAQDPLPLNLMSQPSSVKQNPGSLRIDANFTIAFTGHTESRLERAS